LSLSHKYMIRKARKILGAERRGVDCTRTDLLGRKRSKGDVGVNIRGGRGGLSSKMKDKLLQWLFRVKKYYVS
jgi:hypothetical protein